MVSAIYECENGFMDYQCVLLPVFTGALPEHVNGLSCQILLPDECSRERSVSHSNT